MEPNPKKTEKEYRRLPGVGYAFMGRVRLYQAKDHLLLARSASYTEEYKRFYYKDIQSFTVYRTRNLLYSNLLWSPFFGLGGWGMGLLFKLDQLRSLWVAGAFMLLFLLINSRNGPGCACFVTTAVQTERLRSLNRARVFQNFLKRVRPLIEAAQAPATPAPGAQAAPGAGPEAGA